MMRAQAKKEEMKMAIVKPTRTKPPISLPRLPFSKSSDDDDDDDEVVKGPAKAKKLGGYSFGGGGASVKAAVEQEDEEELSGAGAYCSGNQMMRVLYDYDSKVSDVQYSFSLFFVLRIQSGLLI
jgi:hypothetical protein